MTSLQFSNSVSLLCHCTLVLVYGSVRRWLCMKSYLPNEKKNYLSWVRMGLFLLSFLILYSNSLQMRLGHYHYFSYELFEPFLFLLFQIFDCFLCCALLEVLDSQSSHFTFTIPESWCGVLPDKELSATAFSNFFRILMSQGRFFKVQSHVNVST